MKRRIFPLLVLCVCTALMLNILSEYRRVFLTNDNVLANYAPTMPQTPPTLPSAPPTEEDVPPPELPDNPVDFADLQGKHPEVVGWIQVPNTRINYAIMQSGSNTKEDFYLNHNEAGTKDRNGSIYIQKYNHANFSDPNTIVYGHHMASGRMFADVHKFKDKNFFEDNQYLYVYIPGHWMTYRIYAVFSYEERNPNTGGIKHLLWAYDFNTEEGKQAFIDKTLNPKTRIKQVREGVTPTTEDRLITLSTCIDGSQTSGRLLLVAVLESDILTK